MRFIFTRLLLLLAITSGNLVFLDLSSKAIAQPASQTQERPAIANANDQKSIHTLVKTALIAVNQGNLTGNYTVLRDLGNAAFRQNNTSADFGVLFAEFRRNNIDFGGIVEYAPIFTQVPLINNQNVVRTTGYFPTTPNIQFDIIYQLVNNRYQIDSISVAIQEAR